MGQQQRFVLDGIPVTSCEGAFMRRFEMTPDDAEAVSYDDTVVLVVVARMVAPAFRTDKNGELIRVNKFELQAGRVAATDMGYELAEMFDLELQQQLSLPMAGQQTLAPVTRPSVAPQAPMPAASAVGPPVGTPVPSAAPGAGSHAHDAALRAFLA